MLVLPDITKRNKPFFLQSKFETNEKLKALFKKTKNKESSKKLQLNQQFTEDHQSIFKQRAMSSLMKETKVEELMLYDSET